MTPGGSGIPGHALQDDGRPYRSQGVEDVPAEGPDGFTRCECRRSSGLRSSDASRRAWHARHVEDERARARLPVSAVHEVQGQHQDGQGGEAVKDCAQASGHGSSRCWKRARESASLAPLCAAGRHLTPCLTW